jgi:hypothetical protein
LGILVYEVGTQVETESFAQPFAVTPAQAANVTFPEIVERTPGAAVDEAIFWGKAELAVAGTERQEVTRFARARRRKSTKGCQGRAVDEDAGSDLGCVHLGVFLLA